MIFYVTVDCCTLTVTPKQEFELPFQYPSSFVTAGSEAAVFILHCMTDL